MGNNEIELLKKEIERLKLILTDNNINYELNNEEIVIISKDEVKEITIDSNLSLDDKINLYLDYFKGRSDVFAMNYISNNGTTGISTHCLNRFTKFCNLKAHPRCKNCLSKSYRGINKKDILKHFKGDQTYAIYPINKNDESNFFCIEFLNKDKEFIIEFQNICLNNNFDTLLTVTQRNTYLVWGFFLEPTKAIEVRRVADELLKCLLSETEFSNLEIFDYITPNQNYQPKDSLGVAITLPISGKYIKEDKTIFLDKEFNKIDNPSNYLTNIKKITKDDIFNFLSDKTKSFNLINHNLIELKEDKSELTIDYSNDIIFRKKELSNNLYKKLCILATTTNKEFIERQKKRLSIFGANRILFLFKEDEDFLYIPRGCYKEVFSILKKNNIVYTLMDLRIEGTPIMFSMYTELYDSQVVALDELIKYDNGLLVAPPAFGKTILAIGLIERLGISTAIIVDKTSLIEQWQNRLKEHSSVLTVGEYHGRKKSLTGIVDVLSFQSLKDTTHLLEQYGLIIIDEVHHVAAKTLQQVIRAVKCKHIYGLTATPQRSDGNENVIYLTIGDIRYEDKTKENHSFTKTLTTKTTSFKCPNKLEYVNQMNLLFNDEGRNNQIITDVIYEFNYNKKILILTDRIEHTEIFYKRLKHLTKNIVIATGKLNKKEKDQFLEDLVNYNDEPFILIATGKFIGEGFDEKRLDTLFITMPFKWSGTLSQYVGRLHRTDGSKETVKVYDYVDNKVGSLLNMFSKRLEGYRSMDYIIEEEEQIINLFDEKLVKNSLNIQFLTKNE
ncbi:MAG: DEAD/DEAH box helicase family protein [bacterium]